MLSGLTFSAEPITEIIVVTDIIVIKFILYW